MTATRTRRASSARPRKTEAERDAELTAIKADLDAAIERLANDPVQWVTFLDTVADFAAKYSANNQLLIMIQCLERGFQPTMVRPYGTRDKATGKARAGWAGGWLVMGRNVKSGEKALKIFRPNMRRMTEDEAAAHVARTGHPVKRDADGRLPKRLVGFALAPVFDVAQTEGEPVELPTFTRKLTYRAPGGARPELLTGDDTTGALDDIVKLIKSAGYTFELAPADTLHGANGVTNSMVKTVKVRDDVDGAQTIKTAVHELAHVLLHVDSAFDYVAHRGRAETEAESVAYVVLRALGLDSEAYSAPYVATWAEADMSKVHATAQTVVKTARTILDALEGDAAGEDDAADDE